MPRHKTRHIRTTIGANIRALRKAQGITQMQLAVAIGSDPIGVSRWERGVVMPRHENLELVAEALGVDVGFFYMEQAA